MTWPHRDQTSANPVPGAFDALPAGLSHGGVNPSSFSDFLLAQIVLQDPRQYTLAVGLYQFVSVEFGADWGVFTAGAVLSALPVVLLFLFLLLRRRTA